MKLRICLMALAMCAMGCAETNNETGTSPTPVDTPDTEGGTDTDVPKEPDTLEAEPDASPDTVQEDAVSQDAAADTVVEAWEPPPFAPEAEKTPLDGGDWAVTFYNPNTSPAGDSVYAALENGTFVPPTEKGTHYDQWWKVTTPGVDGVLDQPGGGSLLYGATTIEVEEPTYLTIQADRIYTVWINDARQPGDLYASGAHRTPALLQAGTNQIVVRGFGSSSPPTIKLWTSPHEVTFNNSDITGPDLVGGESLVQFAGVPMLNHSAHSLAPVYITVAESDILQEWTGTFPGVAPGTMTKIPIQLTPQDTWPDAGTEVEVTVQLSAEGLEWSYEHTFTLTTADGSVPGPFRRTFLSDTDGSAQFYGEMRPTEVVDGQSYSLVLSLHGASVDAKNQAGSYSAKDWTYLAAATNRRPFGFDWQAWGRRDAIEVLDHAMATYNIDPTKVYLTGHSMGGHGTWHVGTLFTHRFAVLAPSAGWINFETYGGANPVSGAFATTQTHFDPRDFKDNLETKGVYLIHGTADDNVPIWHAETMYAELEGLVPDLFFHKEEGAGHWWNGDNSAGVDCVDWPGAFELMETSSVDPLELNFHYTAPAPWVNATYSYVTIRAAEDQSSLSTLDSALEDDVLTLTTSNVRGMVVDGAALASKGVSEIRINGETLAVEDGDMAVGPQTGKHPEAYGPYNQVFHKPFCFVYPQEGPLSEYAAYILANWAIIGNGSGCALPLARVTDELRAERNLIYLGMPSTALDIPAGIPAVWGSAGVGMGSNSYPGAAMAFIFPEGDRLSAAMVTSEGDEVLLYRLMPFTSRIVYPDYYIWNYAGGQAAGIFSTEWEGP